MRLSRHLLMLWCVALAVTHSGCRNDMRDEARTKPLEESEFFEDGRSSRMPVPGTVARGQLREDAHLYQGLINDKPADTFPFSITQADLQRGRERYNIYCSACHGMVGNGLGMVAQRGFKQPPSFHLDRLREAPVGHFYRVITQGYGVMYDYAAQLSPEDRWRVVAYLRALQRSQAAVPADAPEEERQKWNPTSRAHDTSDSAPMGTGLTQQDTAHGS